MVQANKFFYFTLLIWLVQYSYEVATSSTSWNKIIKLNNISDVRVSRLLYGETDLYDQQRYQSLKEKAKHIEKEDEYIFGKRLNKLLQSDGIKEQFKKNMYNEELQKTSDSLNFKDNSNNSYDSLTSIDYLEDVHDEIKGEPIRMKWYKSKEKSVSPLTSNHHKIVYPPYKRGKQKILYPEYKKTNKFIGKYDKRITKKMINIFTTIILFSSVTILVILNYRSPQAVLASCALLALSILYLHFKGFKKFSKSSNIYNIHNRFSRPL
ncbi:Plasmodium exported protein, unknown function [Plasmodium malariae]|uniref:Pv-fam-d protein n=1 Tax=Plasmodium malariae TaxID=5858 RepID=A0A1A8WL79_PLAMA|nr:Plasmodium exported protein, unknown function [Plasmodium malariae]SBS92606.1 Plasmodium exported protein, unknown function [Plasmodium malariae]SBT87276.1 Plasmodium exported protein, unknown function [Plasmodium malariae]